MKYIALLSGLLLLGSCTGHALPDNEGAHPLEIQLTSGIGGITADTRGEGVIDGIPAEGLPASFIRLDAQRSGYPATYDGARCVSGVTSKYHRIHFDEAQHYRTDGYATTFIGWYPLRHATKSEWDAATGTVTCGVDGSTDIMVTQPVSGSVWDRFGEENPLVFTHLLSQVVVSVQLADAHFADSWGSITDIEFIGKKQSCILTLPSPPQGTADWQEASVHFTTPGTDLKMQGKGTTSDHATIDLKAIGTTPTEVGYALLAPHQPREVDPLQLKITTSVGKGHTVEMEYTATGDTQSRTLLEAGKRYTIALTFHAKEVTFTGCTIGKWNDGGTNSAELL